MYSYACFLNIVMIVKSSYGCFLIFNIISNYSKYFNLKIYKSKEYN